MPTAAAPGRQREMEPPASKRKRTRTSSSPDGDDRKRGRPRVEKQDESAADRRRTQIRMAQRAYRQRKESTLDELRKRVADLTQTIELMNKAFVTCTDRMYASNLTQDQMMDLHEVSTQFEKLVGEARNPSENGDAESHANGHRAESELPAGAEASTQITIQPKNVPSWIDQTALAKANATERTLADWGYTLSLSEDETLQTADLMELNVAAQEMQEMAPLPQPQAPNPDEPFNIFSADLDVFPMMNAPSPPRTYSFQETSFARRLHRACAEAAYHLLLDPRRRPAEYERIFRLSLLGRDRAKIISQLKGVLDRGPHEDLDFWEAPHIHVGGAGTHYPRRDPYGNLLPRKSSYNVGRVGPQTLATLEHAAKQNFSMDMTVELAGFEGEWFDPYDVQGYLEEKGIFIDPSSSFAEAQIVEWPKPSSDASTMSSEGHVATPPSLLAVPGKATPLTTAQVNVMINEADVDFSKWDDSANLELTNVGYSDAEFGSWMNFLQPGESIKQYNSDEAAWQGVNADPIKVHSVSSSQPASPPQQPKRKSVIIDVSKLVKVMIVSAVCLGRTPGFRRRDVDRALAISSFDAF